MRCGAVWMCQRRVRVYVDAHTLESRSNDIPPCHIARCVRGRVRQCVLTHSHGVIPWKTARSFSKQNVALACACASQSCAVRDVCPGPAVLALFSPHHVVLEQTINNNFPNRRIENPYYSDAFASVVCMCVRCSCASICKHIIAV